MSVSTAVLSRTQALQRIPRRAPVIPVEYEAAVKALQVCIDLDETKYWSDKADALAAWAKIYHDGAALRKAKMLKLHAFRRMGQIAGELKPLTNGKGGRQPGAVRALTDAGLTHNGAIASRRLASISQKRFDKILEQPKAPTSVVQDLWVRDEAWADFVRTATSFRSAIRRHTPATVANGCRENDRFIVTARELISEITEFMDELDQRLSKKKAKAA